MTLKKKVKVLNKKISSQVLSLQLKELDTYLQEVFLHATGEVCYYERVRYLEDQPIAYEFAYLNPKYINDISVKDLSSSLENFVESKGIRISNIKREFKATIPPANVLNMLNIEQNTPVIKVDYFKYLDNGEVLEYAKIFYNQNIFKFVHNSTIQF